MSKKFDFDKMLQEDPEQDEVTDQDDLESFIQTVLESGEQEETSSLDYIVPSAQAGLGDILTTMGGVASFFVENGGEDLIREGQLVAQAALSGLPAPEFTGTGDDYWNPKWWAYHLPRTFVSSAPTLAGTLLGGVAGAGIAGAGAAASAAAIGGTVGSSAAAGLSQLGSTYADEYQTTKSHDKAFDTALKTGVATGAINAVTLGMLPKILGSNFAAKSFLHNLIAKSGSIAVQMGGESVDQIANNLLTGKEALSGSLDAALLSFGADAVTTGIYSGFQMLTPKDLEALDSSPRTEAEKIYDSVMDDRDPTRRATEEVEGKIHTSKDHLEDLAASILQDDIAPLLENIEKKKKEENQILFEDLEGTLMDEELAKSSSYSSEDIESAISGDSDLLFRVEEDPDFTLDEAQRENLIEDISNLEKSINRIDDRQKRQITDESRMEAIESSRKEKLLQVAKLQKKIRSDSINRIRKMETNLNENALSGSVENIITDFDTITTRLNEVNRKLSEFKRQDRPTPLIERTLQDEKFLLTNAKQVATDAYLQAKVKQLDNSNISIRDKNGDLDQLKVTNALSQDLLKNGATVQLGKQKLYVPARNSTPEGLIAQTNNFFQSVKDQGVNGRIPLSPLRDQAPKRSNEIQMNLRDSLGVQIFNTLSKSIRALGSFNPSDFSISLKPNNLDVLAHEVGHFVDNFFNLFPTSDKDFTHDLDSELISEKSNGFQGLSRFGSLPPRKHPTPRAYRRGEGFAEFVRSWLVNPDEARSVAPRTFAMFEKKVSKKVQNDLRSFGDDLRRLAGVDSTIRAGLQIVDPKPPSLLQKVTKAFTGYDPTNTDLSFIEHVKATMIDDMIAVKKAIDAAKDIRGLVGEKGLIPIKDPFYWLRTLPGIGGKYHKTIQEGMLNMNGKSVMPGGLSWLTSDLDSSSVDAFDRDKRTAETFMISERTVEMAKRHVDEGIAKRINPIMEEIELITTGELKNPKINMNKRKALEKRVEKLQRKVYDFTRFQDLIMEQGFDEATSTFSAFEREMIQDLNVWQMQISGIGQGLFSDLSEAYTIIKDVKSRDEEWSRIKVFVNKYRQWADANLRLAVEAGLLDEDGYQFIKENNEYYVAMSRLVEPKPGEALFIFERGANGQIKGVTLPDELQRVQFNGRDMYDPVSSLMRSSFQMLERADMNRFWNTFTDLISLNDDVIPELAGIGKKLLDGEEYDGQVISVYRGGKLERWVFNNDIMKVAQGMMALPSVPAGAQAFGRLLRKMITSAPPFIVKNLIRDRQQRYLNSRELETTDLLKLSTWNPLNKNYSNLLSELQGMGGDQAGFYFKSREDYYGIIREHLLKDVNKPTSFYLNPLNLADISLEFLDDVGASFERSTRVSEFEAVKQGYLEKNRQRFEDMGFSDEALEMSASLEAALQSRDLMDFHVGGSFIKWLNQMVPFTNAAVQGLMRSYMSVKEKPGEFVLKSTLLIGIPKLLTYAFNAMRDDLEEYRQQPHYVRDMFLSIKLGDNTWLRIPQPYEYALLGASYERAIDYLMGNEEAWENFDKSAIRALLPIDEGALLGPLRPIVEPLANYDFFRGRHIVSPYEKNLKVSLREGSQRASRVSQGIQGIMQENLPEWAVVDARNLDHMIKSMFAYQGLWSLQLSDAFLDEKRTQKNLKNFTRSMLGVISTSPGYSAQDVQFILDTSAAEGFSNKRPIRQFRQLLYKDTSNMTERQIELASRRLRWEAKRLRSLIENGVIKR